MKSLPLLAFLALSLLCGVLLFLQPWDERALAVAEPFGEAMAQSESAAAELTTSDRPAQSRQRAGIVAADAAAGAATSTAPNLEARILLIRAIDAVTRDPVAGATLVSRDEDTPFRATAGASAEFRVAAPASTERLRVLVEADSYLHYRGSVDFGMTVEVLLWPLELIHGSVVNAETGAPVSGARVGFLHPDRSCQRCEPAMARADTNGRYELLVAPQAGRLALTIGAEGYPT